MLRKTLFLHHRLRLLLGLSGRGGLTPPLVNLQVILFQRCRLLTLLIVSAVPTARPRRRFKSSRLIGEFEKPWLEDNKKKLNWDSIIFYTCASIALGKYNNLIWARGILTIFFFKVVSGYICWAAYAQVPKHEVSSR